MYDVIVLGGGPAGYHGAIRAAQLGGRVCLVEADERPGGVCLNRGCIPTKALMKSIEVLRAVETAGDFGIEVDQFKIDFPSLMRRSENLARNITRGLSDLFETYKIDVIQGFGKITGPNHVEVGGKTLEGKNILVATGSRPLSPPSFPSGEERVISTTQALKLEELPESMIVAGAGYAGCEFAHIFRSLGCKVSVVEMMETVLPNEDAEISRQLSLLLRREGIGLYLGEKIEAVTVTGDAVQCRLSGGEDVRGAKLLLCVGREANIEDVGLEGLGVKVEGERIVTNEKMQTNVPSVYAAGDVVHGTMLAHVAFREGIVAAENALGVDSAIDYDLIPHAVFTHPEVASVGLTEAAARDRYDNNVITGKFPFMANGKALCDGEPSGFLKIVAKSDSQEIVGVHILGAHASDLISEGSLAIHCGATLGDVAKLMHPHPSFGEVFMEAASDGRAEAIHLPQKITA